MARSGCLGQLLWLPAALLGGTRPRAVIPQKGLDAAKRDALLSAQRASAAISQKLHAAG